MPAEANLLGTVALFRIVYVVPVNRRAAFLEDAEEAGHTGKRATSPTPGTRCEVVLDRWQSGDQLRDDGGDRVGEIGRIEFQTYAGHSIPLNRNARRLSRDGAELSQGSGFVKFVELMSRDI